MTGFDCSQKHSNPIPKWFTRLLVHKEYIENYHGLSHGPLDDHRFSWIIRCHYKAVFAGMLIQKQVLLSSCQRCFTTIHSIITGMASNQSTIAAIITIFISIYESVRSEFSLPERAHVLWQVAGFRSRWTTFMAWIFSTPTRIVVTVFRKQRGGPNVQAWKRHELSFKGQGC